MSKAIKSKNITRSPGGVEIVDVDNNDLTLKPIDIPVDFKELITLQPLITQIEVFELLKKNLDAYRWNYFMSQQHTAFQVLAIIPEDQWQEYFVNTFKSMKDRDETLPEYFKSKYTKYCNYGSMQYRDYETQEIKTAKHKETYVEAVQEIIIDTKKRRLLFVNHNVDHGHQYYGRNVKYHLEGNKKGQQILTVEFEWSFVPWYSNRSAPKYFSHYYKFDLVTDSVISIDKSEQLT